MELLKNQALKKFKPDADRAAQRWEAYWQGEIIDRPILIASTNKPDYNFLPGTSYHDRVFGNMELDPSKTIYRLSASSKEEFERLEQWFFNNM